MHEIELEKFGVFYGAHLDGERLDRLMHDRIRHVDPWLLGKQERMLFRGKWFDYRFMHPTLATYLFARSYTTIYKVLFRRHVDHARAEGRLGFKDSDIFNSRELSGFWRARQHADAIGMPYELYIELAMEGLMRISRSFLPRPTQLYGDMALEAAQKGWRERLDSRLYVANDPRYRNDRFEGTPAQVAHRNFMLDQIGKRANRAHLVAQYVWKDPVLTEGEVVGRFGPEILDQARAVSL